MIKLRGELESFCLDLIERHDLASADVVGFSTLFAQTTASIAMARLIKERNKNCIVVFGGANCEPPMGDVLAKNIAAIDYVFSGPALCSFPDFIGCLVRGQPGDIPAIRGVSTRRNLVGAGVRTAIGADRDIEDFIVPDYRSFVDSLAGKPDLAVEQTGVEPILYFETSRGCWWGERSHCTFCGLNGLTMDYRSMSPPLAIRQFRWLFSFAPEFKNFHCTDNIMPRSYAKQVFPYLDRPEGVSILYEVKLPLSIKEMRAMADAGVNLVQPGIEALSTDTLKRMAKGTTAFQNIQFLKNCLRFGISPLWNLLIGFPGEPESVYEKYAQDLPLLAHLEPASGAYPVRFDRYSPYFAKSKEYGLTLKPFDYYGLIFPFEGRDLESLAYNFQDTGSGDYAKSTAKWTGPLSDLVRKWRESWASGPRPRLDLERGADGKDLVYDSRFGEPVITAVDEEMKLLMQRLSSPKRPAELSAELALPSEVVSSRLRLLRERRMLFEEGGLAMSLVITDTGL